MARLLYRLGAAVSRRRTAVLLLWLVVLGAAGAGAVTLAGGTSDELSIPGQESTAALDRIAEEFGPAGGASARVVLQAADGQPLTSGANATTVGSLVAELARLPGVVSASDPFDPAAPSVSPDQRTAFSTVTYAGTAGEVTQAQKDALLDTVEARGDGPLVLAVTGEAITEPPHVGGPAEVVGVLIAVLVLAVTYGSLALAGMTLLSAAVGVGAGVLGITIATGFLTLQSTTPILASMLGLAVGIDYALFIVTRFRQELRAGRTVDDAVATAVGTAGSAVLTAGLTVVIALAGLSVVGIPFLTSMGVAAAATIVVAVLVALTLVPSVLALLGRRALPRRQRVVTGAMDTASSADALAAGRTSTANRHRLASSRRSGEPARGFLARWAAGVTRRRVTALVLSVLALGVIAIPVTSMRTTLVQATAADSTQARAEQMLAGAFGEGMNGPITVLLDGAGAPELATELSPGIAELADVAAVTPAVANADGTAALVTVLPQSGPASEATEQLVIDLRTYLGDALGSTAPGDVSAFVTGATAVSVDVAASLDAALPIYLILVVGLALLLLVLVFRSLLVPAVGVLGFLLTVGASLGATVAVFQWGWLGSAINLESTGPLISLAPILVIGILFGLAMDYQVFLVSRMHEAHSHGARPIEAIRTGFGQAAPVVVAAALIMFAVFAGFVPAGETVIKAIAFALAVGILVDALVVRMILVPAALALLGDRAWWLPRGLRWLPTLDVEGAELDEHRQSAAAVPARV